MSKKMFAQLCATVAIAVITLLLGRSMHDLGTVILFAVGVLATLLSAFRVRSIRVRELAEKSTRVPQNAATGEGDR
jgi:type IV secretory pathway VirB2 component (pilin)